MRLLFVHTTRDFSGGIAGYIKNLVARRAMDGLVLFVLRNERKCDPNKEEQSSFTSVYGSQSVDGHGSKLDQFVALVRNLHEIVRLHGIDLLHAHGLKSATACLLLHILAGRPYVYTNHGLRYSQKKHFMARLAFYFIELLVCLGAREVICVRPFDYRRAKAQLWTARNKIHMICTELDAPKDLPRTLSARPSMLCVSVGSAIPIKRPHVHLELVQALRHFDPSCTGLWVGDGSLRAEMAARAEAAHTPVKFVGQRTRTEVFETLRIASFLLICSEFEVAPLVAIEAMAAGCPVVATPFPGVEDFVTHRENGFLLGPEVELATAKALVAWLSDRTAWTAASRLARRRFEKNHANPERMALKYRTLFDKHEAKAQQPIRDGHG